MPIVTHMRLVVKKWIPQYGATIHIVSLQTVNKEKPLRRFFFTKKALLTSKRNLFMLFIEWYPLTRLSYGGVKNFTRTRRTIHDYATRWSRTLPVSLMPINVSASFAIVSRS